MRILLQTGRAFFGASICSVGINQLIFGDFRPVVLPSWPVWRNESPGIAAYLSGAIFILAGLAIIFNKKGCVAALSLGTTFLGLALFWHLPFILFISPHKITHFGVWADASKTLALAGCAFVVAGSWKVEIPEANKLLLFVEKLIPFGPIFYSITMIEFGIDHFLYIGYISTMVPGWMGAPVFWTYFGGGALIGSGMAVAFKIKLPLIAFLQSAMLFLWFILLHVPGAVLDPVVDHGNLVVSAGDALAFCGTSLLIGLRKKKFTSTSAHQP